MSLHPATPKITGSWGGIQYHSDPRYIGPPATDETQTFGARLLLASTAEDVYGAKRIRKAAKLLKTLGIEMSDIRLTVGLRDLPRPDDCRESIPVPPDVEAEIRRRNVFNRKSSD